jgi:hypothetical protein
MTTVTVNDAVIAVLGSLTEVTVIQDASEKVLGKFLPIDPREQELYERGKALVHPEEAERRLREEKDRAIPLKEFWAPPG